MDQFIKNIEVRWSDLDPNFHMLHSKYYDLGAFCRMAFFVEHGLTPAVMKENNIGLILFREECIFKKEIIFGDKVSVNLKLRKLSADYSKWSMVHEIITNDSTIAAIINADGAWMNTILRKLALPPLAIGKVFDVAPRSQYFNS